MKCCSCWVPFRCCKVQLPVQMNWFCYLRIFRRFKCGTNWIANNICKLFKILNICTRFSCAFFRGFLSKWPLGISAVILKRCASLHFLCVNDNSGFHQTKLLSLQLFLSDVIISTKFQLCGTSFLHRSIMKVFAVSETLVQPSSTGSTAFMMPHTLPIPW